MNKERRFPWVRSISWTVGATFIGPALYLISPWFDPGNLPSNISVRSGALLESFGGRLGCAAIYAFLGFFLVRRPDKDGRRYPGRWYWKSCIAARAERPKWVVANCRSRRSKIGQERTLDIRQVVDALHGVSDC
jgi:hypothetical protein